MFSPKVGTWQYSPIHSAVICLRVTRSGSGTRSAAALYHPFIWCQDSLWRGGSAPSSFSISSPASSFRRLLSPLRLVLIMRHRRRMRAWSLAVPLRAETLSFTSLHVYANIHVFFLSSQAFGLGVALFRTAKSLSSLVEVVGGRRGVPVLRPRYLVFSLRGAL